MLGSILGPSYSEKVPYSFGNNGESTGKHDLGPSCNYKYICFRGYTLTTGQFLLSCIKVGVTGKVKCTCTQAHKHTLSLREHMNLCLNS